MESWINAFSISVLIVTVPLTFVLRVLLQLPNPIARCHARWPAWLNFVWIVIITVAVALFLNRAYGASTRTVWGVIPHFVIAALIYVFGLVLVLRQFSGVYPEFIVTTGWTGLALRKTRYRNIHNIEEVAVRAGETKLRVDTAHGAVLSMTLPTRYVSLLYEQTRRKHQDG